jgi:hypothetical protein
MTASLFPPQSKAAQEPKPVALENCCYCRLSLIPNKLVSCIAKYNTKWVLSVSVLLVEPISNAPHDVEALQ